MWRVKGTACECAFKTCPTFLHCQYTAPTKKCLQFYASAIVVSLRGITGAVPLSCIKNCAQEFFLSKGFNKCIRRKRCFFSYLIFNSILIFFPHTVAILLFPKKKEPQIILQR